MKTFQGYSAALEFDKKVNALLEEFPPDEENAAEWFKFGRILETTGQIVAKSAMELSLRKTFQAAKSLKPDDA